MARIRDENFENIERMVDQSPNRSVKATDIYILKGDGEEVYDRDLPITVSAMSR